nr:hypothetical protein [uncultured Flavobacterium sp.]
MSHSYSTKTLVCLLLSCFSLIWAKGKVTQPFLTQVDVDSAPSPRPKIPYGLHSYIDLPVSKAFQAHNALSLKSNSSHRRGKGKAAVPVL